MCGRVLLRERDDLGGMIVALDATQDSVALIV
jgi:hypothetical protein